MQNPLRGVYLNGNFYNYVYDSYHEDITLKNDSTEAQINRHFNGLLGKAPEVLTLTVCLENTKNIYFGDSTVGSTTWLGVSQLADMKSWMGGNGASMPIPFVTPYGSSFLVVPIGKFGIDVFNPESPATQGVEFRVTLTLAYTG